MSGRKRRVAAFGGGAAGLALVAGLVAAVDANAAPSTVAPLSASAAAALAKNANTPVIVLLKNQPRGARTGTAAAAARTAGIHASQSGLRSELAQVKARKVRSYSLINAVSATVSAGEMRRLKANPAVARVFRDGLIRGPENPAAPAAGAAAAAGGQLHDVPGACTPLAKPNINEYLEVTHTQSNDPSAKTARSLGYTGAGVKVAWMAEGIDTDNPEFIRPGGQHVFVDYKDFTGDGTAAPTSGDEAFLDASAIAAQGARTYDVSKFSAIGNSTPCGQKIVGMAPGSSMVGLKVFGETNSATTSGFLQAIQYAVGTGVNVLDQSFGSNPFPDVYTQDVVSAADTAAVQAGVTVTVSSGDAGTTSTLGSPSTNPNVIEVGASTTYRYYAQNGYAVARNFGTGWISDNISSLSSGGFSQQGRIPDLIGPGEGDYAACTADPARFGCANYLGQSSDIEESGGTSESAPLTAGAAALVIQAYRKAHGGASPSPALVKQILMSTADDLGHPAYEQGSGLLDSYKAVQAAASVATSDGSPAATGSTILTSPTTLSAIGSAGASHSWPVRITNTGASSQTVKLSGRTLGKSFDQIYRSVTLSDADSPKLVDVGGLTINYETFTFPVAAGADRLDSSLAYPGDPANGLNARVRMSLFDPSGKLAANSRPQGVGNYGHVDVRNPQGGTWRAVIWSRQPAVGGTVGKVVFGASLANDTSFGGVSSNSVTLAPGQTKLVHVYANLPKAAGDLSGAFTLDAGAGGLTSIPVSLRSLVNPAKGGAFSGILTGGNGRQANTGQTNYYQFDVPAGQRDITVDAALSAEPGDSMYGYLVDPDGQTIGLAANRKVTGFDSTGAVQAVATKQLTLYANHPTAGRWTLIINFAGASTGKRLATPFAGSVKFDQVDISAPLPNSPAVKLAAGTPVTIPVTIHNTGSAPESFFPDGRLATTATITPPVAGPTQLTVPLKPTDPFPAWLVPTHTDKISISAQATGPVNFDYFVPTGDPDLAPDVYTPNGAAGSFSADPVTAGFWGAIPAQRTVYGSAPASTTTTVTMALTAHTQLFDPAVSSPVPDLWQEGSARLFTVAPGQTRTLPVTVTPTGKSGTVVKGSLNVDVLGLLSASGTNPFGTELVSIPYAYTIK